jgi:hypothetical protein
LVLETLPNLFQGKPWGMVKHNVIPVVPNNPNNGKGNNIELYKSFTAKPFGS